MLLLLARPRWPTHSRFGALCLRQLTQNAAVSPASASLTRRLLATSTTAIQAPTKSSARFEFSKEQVRAALFELSNLKCANESRIQLALRCLEQDTAPIRVAVLGASVESPGSRRESMCAPARFLRVLLADPLVPAQRWEEELVNWCGREEAQGLLLRYSQTPIPLTISPNSPLATLWVPSPFLQSHNLEILLTSLPPSHPSEEDVYVPTLVAPIPASNYDLNQSPHRSTGMVMRYPVHKSIIFADGLGELFTTMGLISHLGMINEGLDNVQSVAWLPGIDKQVVQANMSHRLQLLDLEAVESAFDHFRSISPDTGAFQREYLASGLGELQNWVKSGTEARPHSLPGATRSLINSIMRPIASFFTHPPVAASFTMAGVNPQSPPSTVRTLPRNIDTIDSLTDAMRSFSTSSHQELKSSLDIAFASQMWNRGLAWYRLLLNLDDVAYLASYALSGRILPTTELEGWALAGRMWGAGFREFSECKSASAADYGLHTKAKVKPTASEEEIVRVIAAADSYTHFPSPTPTVPGPYKPVFPSFFHNARATVATALIPSLHSAATTHVLASASLLFTSFFTTTLLHLSEVPLYTSFTATAVGSILSMGYLQRKWEREKASFEHEVREVARQAVVSAERWGWGVLRNEIEKIAKVEGEKGTDGSEEGFDRNRAERVKKAVKQGLAVLEKLNGTRGQVE
ncbi:hypothetical protein L211DRAFT_842313 [Terfezia boudieri ATCC MYA-4762]|uniref:Mmc1 C-terminal domain-containing protein n=1 Tax=Terfezia boudieri ATCC MYA-4762 TaxID=1051890 RepID=A0A3N4LAF9_9PEZI|nr:hypothetical protein L211DRAFT_842313 [Terfezia boudieri ATCC MYA-4762]